MPKSKKANSEHLPPKLRPWADARKRFRLSHDHIQMARELGLNPKKLGGLANHKQEPWKAPLPVFIEDLYFERFERSRPDIVRSLEEIAEDQKRKRAERKSRKQESSPHSRSEDELPF